jgi:hypothetical protein
MEAYSKEFRRDVLAACTLGEVLAKWRYGSLFRSLGFVASNKSVVNKPRLPL